MANYAFTMPILPGKTDTWKKYAQEMKGPRHDELNKSRQKVGIKTEQVWLQHTPNGDMVVVHWESSTDNPTKIFEQLMKSNEPFDKWFREKILIECHGMDINNPPPKNEMILDNKIQMVGEKEYSESRKR